MSGHRKKPKQIGDVDRFLAETTAMHKTIIYYQRELRPGFEHYDTLFRLHNALLAAIREITGDEPPWMKPATAEEHPGHPIHKRGLPNI